MRELKGHTSHAYVAAFSPDGRQLATGSADNSVRLWDVASGRCTTTIRRHGNWVYTLAYTHDGKTLITADYDKRVLRHNPAHGRSRRGSYSCKGSVIGLAVSPDGRHVACGGYGNCVELLDAPTLKAVHTFPRTSNSIYAVRYSPDGTRLAVGGDFGSVLLYDTTARKLSGELKYRDRGGEMRGCRSLRFTQDGQFLFAALGGGVRWWRISGAKRPKTGLLEGHTNTVSCLALTPDGRTLLSASWDGTVRCWDVATGREKCVWDWGLEKLFHVVVAPDGLTAVAGGTKSHFVMWDLAD